MKFFLNGDETEIDDSRGGEPLLWILRDELGLKGAKFGCGHGGCGACTVTVDGRAVTSCTTLLKDIAGKSVTTIEGLARHPDEPVIRAWLAEQVPQCGYCQPGMVMAASALLARNPHPDDADIDQAMSSVLCRCGSYQRVRDAIHRAANRNWSAAPFPGARLTAETAMPDDAVRFNPWVKIAKDGTIVVTAGRSEMGQGVTTSLPMLVAEELEVPMERVRFEFAPADHAYDNPIIHRQITVGSLSMQTTWEPVRRAGAEVRERLVSAAALRWNVAREECNADSGAVVHRPTGRKLDYGVLAEQAAAFPAPSSLTLKPMEKFSLLGKPTERLDLPGHVSGRSIFGADVVLPALRIATVRLPPHFGAKADHIAGEKALAIPGVRKVIPLADTVAIIADDTWAAIRGREALNVSWTGGDTALSSAEIFRRFETAMARDGAIQRHEGDIRAAFDTAPQTVAARYRTPYLAHAPIEPMNCTVRIAHGLCEVWVPTQSPGLAQEAAAHVSGLPVECVKIHSTFLGGGFGRRSVPDIVAQAVAIAKAAHEPIQLLWMRDDDIRHDHYRPASLVGIQAALDASGAVVAWSQRIVGPELANEGVNIPYDIPNLHTEFVLEDPGVPTGYWRSVGASQNAFAIESFVDELAIAAKADPIAFRLKLLGKSPRHHAVLEQVEAMANRDEPAPSGRARGVALYYAHGGWAAQIAEVSVAASKIIVHRVWCAVDCGFAINPDTVRAQIEGGIAFGLGTALKDEITIADGHAVQHGFFDYPLLTIAEMPQIEVFLMPSQEKPTGAGECGVPPIAPAVANAVFAITGKRLRSLPLRL
ncbi:MAG TPA: molybdopterin cofactor-binding domain-containing protein [Stellaceae bacterium]|nr:molybdopterin cofactor-binding domain-containing protein [Stellaceae bacterium]